jgi:hypothetical protein
MRIGIEDLKGFDAAKARQAVYDLNQKLKVIAFASHDEGIVWRQRQRKPARRR